MSFELNADTFRNSMHWTAVLMHYFWSNVSTPDSRQPPVASATHKKKISITTYGISLMLLDFVFIAGASIGLSHEQASVYCYCVYTHTHQCDRIMSNKYIKSNHFCIHPTSKSDTLRLDFTSMVQQMPADSNHIDIDRRVYTPNIEQQQA